MTSDPRILFQTPHFRVIAPKARREGDLLTLNGDIVIECASKDSLGDTVWTQHTALPAHGGRGDNTMYRLLASLAGASEVDCLGRFPEFPHHRG